MNSQQSRTIQEAETTLSPAEVIGAAKAFFARRNGIYAAFLEQESPAHATFRGQGGEELVVGTAQGEHGTRVTASSYLYDQQIARFLETLPTRALVFVAPEPAQAPEAEA